MSREPGRKNSRKEETTPLVYARQNGIATNHEDDPVHALSNIFNMIREDGEQDLFIESDSMPSFDFGPPFVVKERLSLTKEAALVLNEVSRAKEFDLSEVTLASLLDGRRARKMKLETPLLDDDEDLTFKWYKEQLKQKSYETLCSKLNLPAELLDDEQDQGMGWPSRYCKVGPALMKEIRAEKLSVGSDIKYFLQNHPSKSAISVEADQRIWTSLLSRNKAGC